MLSKASRFLASLQIVPNNIPERDMLLVRKLPKFTLIS